jgi:uncharacterized protein (TIGR02452 family)
MTSLTGHEALGARVSQVSRWSTSCPMSSSQSKANVRASLRDIAAETLAAIERGSYELNGITHDLAPGVKRAKENTLYYGPDSLLSAWHSASPSTAIVDSPTKTSLLEISAIDGARLLYNSGAANGKIGVLNFASAKNPGGGFIRGAQAQEESLARSSTLYPTLMTETAQQFYKLHNRDPKGGYYSHAMIYSPKIVLFRDDGGGWTEPLEVDMLTSPAVNAGVVRRGFVDGKDDEGKIEKAMKERMARILFLFEQQGVKNVVLGSFGTGVFRNDIDVVAKNWADLLAVEGARFKDSFSCVVFAILGTKTFNQFKAAFESRTNTTAIG